MNKLILLFGILFHAVAFPIYYSQCQQDKIIHEKYFKNKKNGVFVDIGAHNGVVFSNTYFFEKELNWTGLCIEPIPEVFSELKANRKCMCIQGCISNSTEDSLLFRVVSPLKHVEMLSGLAKHYNPVHYKRMNAEVNASGGTLQVIDVKCFLLNDLLKQNGIQHVNLLSIDTEGGELDILKSIDFSSFQIDVITVEDNYHDPEFITFMESKGFKFIQRIEQDLLFVNKNYQAS